MSTPDDYRFEYVRLENSSKPEFFNPKRGVILCTVIGPHGRVSAQGDTSLNAVTLAADVYREKFLRPSGPVEEPCPCYCGGTVRECLEQK